MNPSNDTKYRRANETICELSYHLHVLQQTGLHCDGSCHRGSGESGPGRPCEDCLKSSQTRERELGSEIRALATLIDLMLPLVQGNDRIKLAEAAKREVLGEDSNIFWIGS